MIYCFPSMTLHDAVLKNDKHIRGLHINQLQNVVAQTYALAATGALVAPKDEIATPVVSLTKHLSSLLDFFRKRLHD